MKICLLMHFMMAIEIYNKPTIHYRVEGFSFFICNAWELMLKAHIINKFGEDKIYYKDNHIFYFQTYKI